MILVRAQIAEPASVHDVYARQPIMRIVPVAAVLILATAAAVLASHAPPAARYVPAEIRCEGKVILRGSTSDDGVITSAANESTLPRPTSRSTAAGRPSRWVATTASKKLTGEGHQRVPGSTSATSARITTTKGSRVTCSAKWAAK